jgi:DNA invertase Pin-like site-specific DNA recombinase
MAIRHRTTSDTSVQVPGPVTALYLRASSRDQTESIPAQRQLLERYAADHRLQIGPSYEDFAISGDSCNGRLWLDR